MQRVSDALQRRPSHRVDSPVRGAWLLRAVAGVLLLVQVGLFWCGLPASLHANTDFRVFYTAAHLVLQGRAEEMFSYEAQRHAQKALFGASGQTLPFLYPAYAALLFVPFALLPFGVAYLLFTLVNIAGLCVACCLLCERVPALRHWPMSLRVGLVAAMLPLAEVLIQGQISILLLLLYVGWNTCWPNAEIFRRGWCWRSAWSNFRLRFLLLCCFWCGAAIACWRALCAVPRDLRWSRWQCAA